MRIRIFIWCSSGCGFGYLFDVVPDTDPDFIYADVNLNADSSYQNNADPDPQHDFSWRTFLSSENWCGSFPDPVYYFDIVPDTDPFFFILCGYESGCRSKIQNNADPSRSGCGSIKIRMRIHPVPDADPQHDFSWRTFNREKFVWFVVFWNIYQ